MSKKKTKLERYLDDLKKLICELRKYVHAPGCKETNRCPYTHYKCNRRLGLHTALAWKIAVLLDYIMGELISALITHNDLSIIIRNVEEYKEKILFLCGIIRYHSKHPKIAPLAEMAHTTKFLLIDIEKGLDTKFANLEKRKNKHISVVT